MANPRQRRKIRSSSYKPVKQSRKANKLLRKQPAIRGPKVLQDAWDKHKTVQQNYSALGLAHSLTPARPTMTFPTTAHSRRIAESNPEQDEAEQVEKSNPSNNATSDALGEQASDGKLPRGFGRIMRDASGTIIDVVLADGEQSHAESIRKVGELDHFQFGTSGEHPETIRLPNSSEWLLQKSNKEQEAENEGGKDLLQALEAASKTRAIKERTCSPGEMKYLTRLVETYGTNYEAMARDRKRNANQYSAGEVKRAIEKAGIGPR